MYNFFSTEMWFFVIIQLNKYKQNPGNAAAPEISRRKLMRGKRTVPGLSIKFSHAEFISAFSVYFRQTHYRFIQTPSRAKCLSKPQARLLHAVYACNYLRMPLARQHKQSVFESIFTPSRRTNAPVYSAYSVMLNSFQHILHILSCNLYRQPLLLKKTDLKKSGI